ncbi:MarR family winged helix-turn-helix transcriptional regulator [Allosalinactinospora lopnorensis]|uniref:MarR family winged helix-turn-helix transcriptional regulator n=1 Tax=Allosalinactinospora lopnorensis TaxID=1352348 RepID=UPI000623F4B4|nr:MarR family transcriptional regulator [Allosalinactinospora lopnorensis]
MSAVNWLDAGEQRIWRSFLRVNSLLHEELDRDLQKRHGLTLVEYGILVHLSEAEGQRKRMRGLADSVIVSKSRLSHQIARLERDGLVRRESCSEDRRGAWAVLTDAGEKALQAAAPDHVSRVREYLFDRLSADHVAQLGAIMGVLEEGLRERAK